jgi:hypothetical protein
MARQAADIYLNGKGYMLARAKQLGQGGRAWTSSAIGASVARLTTAEQAQSNQSPTIESAMVWRSFHAGYGDESQNVENRFHFSSGVDTRFVEKLLPGPLVTTITLTGATANVSRILEFNGLLFVMAGNVIKRVASNNGLTTESGSAGLFHAGGGAGDLVVDAEIFNSQLLVSVGTAAGLWKRTTAGVWSQSADVKLGYMTALKDMLYGQMSCTIDGITTTNAVAKLMADPFTLADWSAGDWVRIGDPGGAITCMGSQGDLVYVGTSEGPYALDSSGIAPSLTPELRAYRSTANCKNMRSWHGRYLIPHLRGLLAYQDMGTSGFSVSSVGPGREAVLGNPIRGLITAMAGDDRWLYAALYNGVDTYILAAREAATAEEANNGALVWHPLAKIASVRCDAMHICGLFTNPRLYFGVGANLAYITLPRDADNPLQDANCRYALTGSIWLSRHSWGTPSTVKVWRDVQVKADNLSTTRPVQVLYSLDGGPYVAGGAATESPSSVISLGEQGVMGHDLSLKLTYTLDATTNPIIIRSVTASAAERPRIIEQIQAVVRCADKMILNQNVRERRTGAEIKADLKALADPTLGPIELIDRMGTYRYALVIPPVDERESQAEGEQEPEDLLTVHLAIWNPAISRMIGRNLSLDGVAHPWVMPLTVPIYVGTNIARKRFTLTNLSAKTARPIIVIRGPIADFTIVNLTAVGSLPISFGNAQAIASGDSYTIDMLHTPRTCLDSAGADKIGSMLFPEAIDQFWLVPGDNELYVTGTGIDNITNLSIAYLSS